MATMGEMMDITLRDYQKEAVEKFLEHEKGIIQLPTGSGKTVIALSIYNELDKPNTLIISPTRALIEDMKKNFIEKYNIPEHYISTNPRVKARITFATYAMIGTYEPELAKEFDFYILDEVHHAAGNNFFRNALPIILDEEVPVLGLSASPKTSSDNIKELLNKLPIIYKKTELKEFKPYTIGYLYGVEFSPEDQGKYEKLSDGMKECMIKSGFAFRNMVQASKLMGRRSPASGFAGKYLKLYNERKRLVQQCPTKIDAIVDIVKKHHMNNDKIMIFADSVDELLKVIKKLNQIGIKAYPMTSKTTRKKDLKKVSKAFGKKFNVIGLVKMGEEGIDFPDLNVLIIMGSPKSDRAIIQRIGRVLRYKEGKTAHIYITYVKNTYERKVAEKYIKKANPDKIVEDGNILIPEKPPMPMPEPIPIFQNTLVETILKAVKKLIHMGAR